jgi:glucose/mannose-6-phosphate isomerase
LSFKTPRSYSNIDRVVILGMGGSAIGGDLLNSLASLESKTPISVCRDYNLPQFVDSKTLASASRHGSKL